MRKILFLLAMRMPRPVRRSLKALFPKLAQYLLQDVNFLQPTSRGSLSTNSNENIRDQIFRLNSNEFFDGRKRVAFFSPWTPSKSGIAWHAKRVVNELSQIYFTDVFVSNINSEWLPEKNVYPISYFEFMNARREYDFYVYNLGNGPDHAESLQILRRFKGTIILHDIRIDAIPHNLTPSSISSVKETLGLSCLPSDSNVLVHSEFARKMIANDQNGKNFQITVFKTGLPIDIVGESKINLSGAIGTAGFVTPAKSPECVAEAFGLVARQFPNKEFYFVGECAPTYKLILSEIFKKASGNRGKLIFVSNLDEEAYWRHIEMLDLAVQLRTITHGESSGTAIEIQARGIPVIVTNIGPSEELPSNVFVKVERNISPVHLSEAICNLLNSPDEYQSRSGAGIEWAREKGFRPYTLELKSKLEEYHLRLSEGA